MRNILLAVAALFFAASLPFFLMSAKSPEPIIIQPEFKLYPKIEDPRFLAPDPYRLWVHEAAAEHGIPLDIAIRLAYEESRWWPMAEGINRDGSVDRGIYQLNSRYHEPMLVRENIYTGMKELARCWRETGTWRKAVMAYNAGVRGSRDPGPKTVELAMRVVSGDL